MKLRDTWRMLRQRLSKPVVTCFTINGFMGDMWAGPQADTGRYLSDLKLAYWQPIGYDAGSFPLSGGVASGLAELKRQMSLHPGLFVVSCWSEGAIIWVLAFEAIRRGDPGWPSLSNFKGCTTFGNPYREEHSYAPKTGPGAVPDPGGAGIGGPRNNLKGTPSNWHDYAHPGDMYTVCPTDTNSTGNDIRIIFDLVLTQWSGEFQDFFSLAMTLMSGPLKALPGLVGAIIKSITFFGGGTKQHVNYDPSPSKNYLAGVIRSLP